MLKSTNDNLRHRSSYNRLLSTYCQQHSVELYSLFYLKVKNQFQFFLIHTFTQIFFIFRGSREVKIFWSLLIFFFYLSLRNKTPIYLTWSLIPALLLRPHNVILVPAEILISHQIHKFYNKPKDNIWNSIAHVWLGQVFYFYQVNEFLALTET